MDENICEIPWTCGFVDGCTTGWHLANYWLCKDGYSVDNYTDGDSDPCEESDVPDTNEIAKAWNEYHQYVATTGNDPLNQYHRPDQKQKPHIWQATIRNWIGSSKYGLKVIGVRRKRGHWITPDQAKQEVKDYLFVGNPDEKQRHCLGTEFPNIESLLKLAGTKPDGCEFVAKQKNPLEVQITFQIQENAKPWSDNRLAAYFRKQARQTLRGN